MCWLFTHMFILCHIMIPATCLFRHVGLCLDEYAEGDAHQFFLVAAFLPTSGQSAD